MTRDYNLVILFISVGLKKDFSYAGLVRGVSEARAPELVKLTGIFSGIVNGENRYRFCFL